MDNLCANELLLLSTSLRAGFPLPAPARSAFCDACKKGTPQCLNGAKCRLCAPGYRQGPLGWCIPAASAKRG